jgi:hypothetical protein
LLAGKQSADSRADQRAHLGVFGVYVDVRRIGGHLRCRCVLPRVYTASALVAGHGVQPRPEPVGITQRPEPGRRDNERVLHSVHGVRGPAQQKAALGIQMHRIRVVGLGKPVDIPRNNGRNGLAVAHPLTVATRTHSRADIDKMGHLGRRRNRRGASPGTRRRHRDEAMWFMNGPVGVRAAPSPRRRRRARPGWRTRARCRVRSRPGRARLRLRSPGPRVLRRAR